MPFSEEEKRARARERQRAWRAINREKHLRQLRESGRRQNQKPERKEYARQYQLARYQMDIEAGRKRQRDLYASRKERDPAGTVKEYFRRSLKRHGLTPERYDEMFRLQDFSCAICKTTEPGDKRGWQIDHCHGSKKVRGILCRHCNLMLGYARDNTKTLLSAIDYLERSLAPDFEGFAISKFKERGSKSIAVKLDMRPADLIS